MQSAMSMYDSIALIAMCMPGISSSLFLWLCLDIQCVMDNCDHSLYSILAVYWCICSSIL